MEELRADLVVRILGPVRVPHFLGRDSKTGVYEPDVVHEAEPGFSVAGIAPPKNHVVQLGVFCKRFENGRY